MPLNYSKWDALELSDDSDIEGHPNVDHRSLVNWKRRDIHEKRAMRNQKIADIKAEVACNDVLLPRLRTITEEVHGAPDGPAQFSRIVEQLKTNPSPQAPETDSPHKLTYDEMILSLLLKVFEDAKEKGVDKNDERLREVLIANLKGHVAKLGERQEELKKDLEKEEEERTKKITSESIHDGYDSHYVPPKPEPAAVKGGKSTKTKTATNIEVLNPKAVEAVQVADLAAKNTPTPTSDDEDELPEMTPTLEAFSRLPLRGYDQSFHFIQEHRDVYVPGASDALLVAAFTAQTRGETVYAKKCVHQSLLLQYCEKLGVDGVRLFFKRMTSGDPRAEAVFLKDVEDTHAHIITRVKAAKEEEAAAIANGGEQIQLVPENPDQHISFIVPDGPPPQDLRLEGPGMEDLDIEEVRKALQLRWDVFDGFSDDLKEALRSQSLEEVNKVLGKMKVEDAENVVGLLDTGGILNFAEGGIRDQTGNENEESEEA
ncbi:hsp90-like protein [Phellopilus nigrolimitatus]|nr:hsp90-like protein [Phellopilus nigrolimitatus]